MDEDTKGHIDTLHTMISEMGLQLNNLLPQTTKSLNRYKGLIKEYEGNLNEALSLEVKEKKLNETLTAVESIEFLNITNAKDEETQKPKFTNETSRKTELGIRLKNNPDYQKSKEELDGVVYRKKTLRNVQIITKMWMKYYELEIPSETH